MFFKKTENKRSHPYVALTIGTLAMIGAFNVVKCSKRTVRCICCKAKSLFHRTMNEEASVMEK